jgi:hypothetical protein
MTKQELDAFIDAFFELDQRDPHADTTFLVLAEDDSNALPMPAPPPTPGR